jgi:hypothetical protein
MRLALADTCPASVNRLSILPGRNRRIRSYGWRGQREFGVGRWSSAGLSSRTVWLGQRNSCHCKPRRSEHCSLAALSEIVVDCAIASGLGKIGEPIIAISQAHRGSRSTRRASGSLQHQRPLPDRQSDPRQVLDRRREAGLFIVHCRQAVIESQCSHGSMVDGGRVSRGPPIATAIDLAPQRWGFSLCE